MPFDAEGGPEPAAPAARGPRLRHACNARVEGALTHGVSMPIMISLGAYGMEAIAQPPTTFRLTPRPYQYEAVAALLAGARCSAPCSCCLWGRAKPLSLPCWSSGAVADPSSWRTAMSSSSRPWTNCTWSIRPWPWASCRRPGMSIPPRPWWPVCKRSVAARGWRVWCRISRLLSLTKRTTPPRPPIGVSSTIVGPGGPMARSWSASRPHPSAAITTHYGRCLTALSIRKPCWR